MIQIDIVTTSCLRARVFRKTFDSFQKHLFGSFKEHRLILNIDPIGEDESVNPVLDIAREYFGDNIKLRTPAVPNYMDAFMWVWLNADSDLQFIIEDDWVLLRPFDLNKMLEIMDTHKDLAYLRFSSWGTEEKICKQWNRYYRWNGTFFECPREFRSFLGFCGHPGIFRKEFIHSILPHLRGHGGPEKQINGWKNKDITRILTKWTYGVFADQNALPGVKDIGRKWRTATGFHKDSAMRFKKWIR